MSSIILLVISLISSTFILFFTLKNIQKTGYFSLVLFSITLSAAAFSNYFIERSSLSFGFLFYSLVFLFVRLAFASILIYTLQITMLDSWVKWLTIIFIFVEPAVTQFMLWDAIGIDYFDPAVFPPPVSASLLAVSPPPYLVNNIFFNLVLLLCIFHLSRNISYRSPALRAQSGINLLGLAIALITVNIPVNSNILNAHQVGLLAASIAGISTIPGFFLANTPGITPIAREKVVEFMDDGWLILDQGNFITDLNTAAEKILGLPRNKLISQPAEKIFVDWPNLMNSLDDVRPLDLKGSVRIQENWTYLNIHISPLLTPQGQQVGKLIAWRDITEMRVADEARQHARDEMFILLHSITSAASRALNLDDFLAEAIYQILFSSHSQAISVYLVEEHTKTNEPRNLVLVAQHGKPFMPESQKNSIPESFEIVKWVMEHRAPLLIPDVNLDERLPDSLKHQGPMSLLLMPMIVEGQLLGFISLTRTELPAYNGEDITRLTAVTEEVATFIESNRQRQISIALAERQRLVRDLHDSVTQKLYGLVTLAEATQAGIQAGVTDMPARVIGRMAENARQALKEMRLFLFQMQPVDFERDGLAAVIQNRLSAVEGRADIITRLHADDDISLPVEKQLAVYYIAQEALNNVLKHAKAKNVTVTLRTEKTDFILEVEDNGVGFDPDTTDSGGIVMRSMHERTLQIGGKLNIISAPGIGTKITVTVKNSYGVGETI